MTEPALAQANYFLAFLRPSAKTGAKLGPTSEGSLARALRWIRDREQLGEMDDRLLRDLGLTHEDLRHEIPFAVPAPAAPC